MHRGGGRDCRDLRLVLNATAKTCAAHERRSNIAALRPIGLSGPGWSGTKGGAFIRALQAPRPVPAMALAAVAHHAHAGHEHGHHDTTIPMLTD